MRKLLFLVGGVGFAAATGCAGPAVERVTIPTPGNRDAHRLEYERPKPMPAQKDGVSDTRSEPLFHEKPLASPATPEQAPFEAAYRAVGRPRIIVFVNRTVEGEIAPSSDRKPAEPARTARQPDGAEVTSGGHGETGTKSIDEQAVENIVTELLACQGAVEIVSPAIMRQRLTAEQLRDVESGRRRVLRDVAEQLDTDVLVYVTAQAAKQAGGPEIRLIGEATNVKGGQQIGRALVDMEPPMGTAAVSDYSRLVARKLMADMTQAWTGVAPAGRGAVAPAGELPAPAGRKQ